MQSALLLKYLSEMNSTKDILRLPLERCNESIYVYTSSYINISKGYTILQIYIPCLCGISHRYYHFSARYLDEISPIFLWLCGESRNSGKKVIKSEAFFLQKLFLSFPNFSRNKAI